MTDNSIMYSDMFEAILMNENVPGIEVLKAAIVMAHKGVSRIEGEELSDSKMLDFLDSHGLAIATEPNGETCLTYWSDGDDDQRIVKAPNLREAVKKALARTL